MRKGSCKRTRRPLPFLVTAALLAVLIGAVGYAQPAPCVPPESAAYVGQFHMLAAAGAIDLNNPEHARFTNCNPVPPPGTPAQTHTFGSTVAVDVTINGVTQPVMLFGQATVKIKHKETVGDVNIYTTEMVALDLQGVTPDGHQIMLRESPTRKSPGKLDIRPSRLTPGVNLYNGYFKMRMEISVDGSDFIPDEGGPRTMQLSHSGP